MRLFKVNGVDMYKCESCGTLFEFDHRSKIAVCVSCRPVITPQMKLVNKFRELNAEYIEELAQARIDKSLFSNQKRRARLANVIDSYTAEQWEFCKRYFNYRCAYCGKYGKLTQDHVKPLSKGGNNTVDNIVPACRSCNCAKHDNELTFWYRNRPFYSPERESKIIEYLTLVASSD
ncbi:HNH endonuclease signature motif containing protein [Heyndrickxia oleronia]|uniref:HNH endonuclease signature motif containing protein n=2 Tax=Heyndrickxia oleronia TaxID=38875 RepID=A0AAW6SRE5_9BACI|nr:HNH endonuclease signature motif containing protein [Heyndrickxia oleronia]